MLLPNFDMFDSVEKSKLRCRLEVVDHVVEKISQHDPESFAFRYPTTTDHKPTLKGLVHLDFNVLSREVQDAMHLLGGMATDLHNLIAL